MKKLIVICLIAVFCVSCRARNLDENEAQPQTQPSHDVAAETGQDFVVAPIPDAEMYRQNIAVKAMGDDYIIYEYVDVRIDQIATLASHYCYETNPGKKAYLRDIYMQRNRKRRATFDCVDLATE